MGLEPARVPSLLCLFEGRSWRWACFSLQWGSMTNSGAVCSLNVQHSPDSSETPPVLLLSHRIFIYVLCSRQCDQETAWSKGRMLRWCPEIPMQKNHIMGRTGWAYADTALLQPRKPQLHQWLREGFVNPSVFSRFLFSFFHTESEEKIGFLYYLKGSTQFASLKFLFFNLSAKSRIVYV